MLFTVENGVCGYNGQSPVLKNIDFSVTSGEVLCILGPNGSGKSTLFKSILGLIKMYGGSVKVDGEDIRTWKRDRVARTIGYIPQANNPPFSFTVMDMVLMGRTAYTNSFSTPSKDDEKIANDAVEMLGIRKLANKHFLELSGGEKQLVLIARALSQEPDILIMDEPTAALDFGNQQLVLQQVSRLSKSGLGIIMASHFPDHAFLYSNKALLIKDGGIYACGAPGEVITEQSLKDLYGVDAKIINTGIPSVTTIGNEIKIVVPLS